MSEGDRMASLCSGRTTGMVCPHNVVGTSEMQPTPRLRPESSTIGCLKRHTVSTMLLVVVHAFIRTTIGLIEGLFLSAVVKAVSTVT